jgi:hypothetical protein
MQTRFKEMVGLTASLGIVLGVAFALCNSLFVEVWTSGKVVWSPWNDLLLAVWLFVSSLQTTHCNFVNVTKKIGGMRFIYFVEGCCFIALASLIGSRWGFPGIIGCSIVCTVLFSCQYGLRLSRNLFGLKYREFIFNWLSPSFKLAAILVPIAVVSWLITAPLPRLWHLTTNALIATVIGGLLFLRVGLPAGIIRDVELRLPKPAGKLWQLMVSESH